MRGLPLLVLMNHMATPKPAPRKAAIEPAPTPTVRPRLTGVLRLALRPDR